MFARRLEMRNVTPEEIIAKRLAAAPTATPPATAVSVDQAGPGLPEVRQLLRDAQATVAGLVDADAKAAKAASWARDDVARARAALDEHADLDGRVTRHLASLARAGTGGAGRTILPQDMQDARRAQHEAATILADAVSVLELLTTEAETASRTLEKARLGVAAYADVVAQHVALSLTAKLHETEIAAGSLRVLIGGFASARSLGASPVAAPVSQLFADPWHAALVDLATGFGAGNGTALAAEAAWGRYRVALLADPDAIFEAGPA